MTADWPTVEADAAPTVAEPSSRRPRTGARGRGRPRLPWLVTGAALILAGIGAIIISGSYDEPREARTLGRNLPVNEGASNPLDLSAHNSPALLQSPVEAANLVVADRIDSPSYSCALHASFDGGGRWSQTPIPAPRGESKCFAPDAAFGPDGTLYVSFVTLKGRANSPSAAWVVSSRDGGKTLSQPIETPLGKNAFQVRVSADPRRPGRLYLTYLKGSELGLYKFTETGNPIEAVRSEDGGRSWTDAVRVSSASRQRVVAPSPTIGERGELYVLYLDLGDDRLDYEGAHGGRGGPPYDGTWQLVMARSNDRGGTFRESVVEDSVTPSERFIVFTPPFPSVAVGGGKVYAAFQDGRLGDADVYLWSLSEGSSNWSQPERVNDTRQRDGTSQYLPKVAVSPDGRVDVIYYDRRADPTNVLNEVSLQSSFDRGSSFGGRLRLSDQPFSSRIGFGSERDLADLGSRLGLISIDDRAFGVWTDTRAGTRQSNKQDVARGLVAFNEPPRLAGWLEALLRYGGIALILLGVGAALRGGLGLGSGRLPRGRHPARP